jgi:hypothetical protein
MPTRIEGHMPQWLLTIRVAVVTPLALMAPAIDRSNAPALSGSRMASAAMPGIAKEMLRTDWWVTVVSQTLGIQIANRMKPAM